MISMAIGGVISVGVINLFSANSETYKLMQGQSRLQESSRFALDFLSRAIQQAGYKGCFSINEEVYFTMDEEDIPYEFAIFRGMWGYEYTAASNTWSDGQDGTLGLTELATPYITGNKIDISNVLEGTDVLTIRNLSSIDAPLSADLLNSAGPIEVTIPTNGLELSVQTAAINDNDLVLIHDCEKATIFNVTAIGPPTAGKAMISHTDTDICSACNTSKRLALVNTFETDAAVSAIVTNTFFIKPGAGENSEGDNPFSLWRKAGTSKPVELVGGVENLQVLYGVDTNNDDVPNQYLTANLVTNFADVVTVRISITVNSVDPVGGNSTPTFDCLASGGQQACYSGEDIDGLLRRTFHQTVQLRNQG